MFQRVFVSTVVRFFRMMLSNKLTSIKVYEAYIRMMQVNSRTPKWWVHVLSDISWELQDDIAMQFGLSRCIHCRWVVGDYLDQGHEYCIGQLTKSQEDIDAEIEAAWDAYEAEIELRIFDIDYDEEEDDDLPYDYFDDGDDDFDFEEDDFDEDLFDVEDELLEEVCSCGHKASQHNGSYGEDDCSVCDCQYFGQPVEEYDPPRKVYFGDPGDECGFIGYE